MDAIMITGGRASPVATSHNAWWRAGAASSATTETSRRTKVEPIWCRVSCSTCQATCGYAHRIEQIDGSRRLG